MYLHCKYITLKTNKKKSENKEENIKNINDPQMGITAGNGLIDPSTCPGTSYDSCIGI